MSMYEQLISNMIHQDWNFEYSDDPRLYRQGRHNLQMLTAKLKELPLEDAKLLWDQYAGFDYKNKFNLYFGDK